MLAAHSLAAAALPPGLYHAEVATPDAPWHPRSVTTGFWVKDAALLAAGPKLGVSRDWIRADGRVSPVVGTTYMASDVHAAGQRDDWPLAT